MRLQDIYQLAIECGMAADPRGKSGAEAVLKKAQKTYDKLNEDDREFFDEETLRNPYADTRILNGDPNAEIGRILCGVDMETAEVLLAEALANRGKPVDLILAHHPEGPALVGLPEVMKLQTGALAEVGVLPTIAEDLLSPRAEEVGINVGVSNHDRALDAARLLGYNMMCIHTPCDNLVTEFMTNLMEQEQPETVDDVCRLVKSVPEYRHAAKEGNGPRIVAGSGSHTAGKVYVDFTGGTGGPKEYMQLMADKGISTVLCMHARKEVIEAAKAAHINVVIAGHMPSDSVGLNLLLDKIAARGVEILPVSGLIRVCRS